MKKIEAIVRTFNANEVREALAKVGIVDFIGIEVRRGETETRHAGYEVAFMPKVKIEVVVGDEAVEAAVEAIRQADQAGRRRDHDGPIVVTDVEQFQDIRTGRKETALLQVE